MADVEVRRKRIWESTDEETSLRQRTREKSDSKNVEMDQSKPKLKKPTASLKQSKSNCLKLNNFQS